MAKLDLYSYTEQDVKLEFSFKTEDPKCAEKKAIFIKLMQKAIVELSIELGNPLNVILEKDDSKPQKK